MSSLLLLASFATGLALFSVAGMLALIVGRLVRTRRQASMARCRGEILALLTNPQGGSERVRALGARAARQGALAPIVLEVLGVVRGEARTAFLARLADAEATTCLRHRLRRGRSADRVRAAEALAAFDPREGASALQRACSDTDHRVRFAAFRASIEIGVPPAFDQMMHLALTSPASQQGRALSLLERAASACGKEASHALLRTDLPPVVRIALVAGLGESGGMASADVLVVTAMDRDANVRAAAIGALAAIRAPRGFATIERALRDASWPVRVRATVAVGALQLRSARGALRELLRDESWWVRLRATEALEALGPAPQARSRA